MWTLKGVRGGRSGPGSGGAGGRAEPSCFPIHTLGASPGDDLETSRLWSSGAEEGPLPLETVLESCEREARNTITVTIGNQMPDAAKAQLLWWS